MIREAQREKVLKGFNLFYCTLAAYKEVGTSYYENVQSNNQRIEK